MKLTFRVNGARHGDAARPVSPPAPASGDVASEACEVPASGSSSRLAAAPLARRFGLRVNRGTLGGPLGGASRADLSARPTAVAPEGSEPTVDPTVDRSAS